MTGSDLEQMVRYCYPRRQSVHPGGLSTADGGATWEIFNIDNDYASWGLAWGNGRFVSVGEKPAFTGEGAIYTTD